jgi:predicted phosphodiesterase
MKLLNREICCESRSDTFYLYALGDLHIGARHSAENHIRRLVDRIEKTPNAYWVGGGDLCDCIKPQDLKRWDTSSIADWLLDGTASETRNKLKDILAIQRKRLYEILGPIKHKCLGLVEGNHEYSIRQHYNEDHHGIVCDKLNVPDLTDAAFIRLQFKRGNSSKTIVIFICHGHGGGRAAGSEPNHLYRLAMDKRAHIIMRGHSHSFCILPPVVELWIPTSGKLPEECQQTTKRAGNWGCWLRSWAVGDSTYDSRACYPAKPLSTLEVVIKPHVDHTNGINREQPDILMREYVA